MQIFVILAVLFLAWANHPHEPQQIAVQQETHSESSS